MADNAISMEAWQKMVAYLHEDEWTDKEIGGILDAFEAADIIVEGEY